ncbi:hypothetical protein D3C84_641520 [compost metagenome]
MQQVEAQAPGHGGVTLASDTGTSGDRFTHWQCEIIQRQLQVGAFGGGRQWCVFRQADPVVAARGDGELFAACGAGELDQAHVQVTAGVQGDGRVFGL